MPKEPIPKPYHHGDLKNALIAAGLQILSDRGVAALNLREVARVAGVSHTAPYRHFPDKQALIGAIATEGFEMLAAAIRAVDEGSYGTSTDRLAAAGVAYVSFALQHPAHIAIMFDRENIRTEDSELYRVSKVGFEYLVQHIEIGRQSGELQALDSIEVAKCLWASLHGLAVLVIEGQFGPVATTEVVLTLAETYVRVILAGFGAIPAVANDQSETRAKKAC
jgi:AcrR family transcriptional regulator